MGLDFPYWKGKLLTLKEIEHGLCEYSKYKRIETNMRSGRKLPVDGKNRLQSSRSTVHLNRACRTCSANIKSTLTHKTLKVIDKLQEPHMNFHDHMGGAKGGSQVIFGEEEICHRCRTFQETNLSAWLVDDL